MEMKRYICEIDALLNDILVSFPFRPVPCHPDGWMDTYPFPLIPQINARGTITTVRCLDRERKTRLFGTNGTRRILDD